MDIKTEREIKEYHNLFCDPKYARKAWQQLIGQSLTSEAAALPMIVDKDGNETLNGMINSVALHKVQERLTKQGLSRKPMEAEVMIECNIIKARFTDATFVNIRDTGGAKPVDESKLEHSISNEYSGLTDEELAKLKEFRKEQLLKKIREEQLLKESADAATRPLVTATETAEPLVTAEDAVTTTETGGNDGE